MGKPVIQRLIVGRSISPVLQAVPRSLYATDPVAAGEEQTPEPSTIRGARTPCPAGDRSHRPGPPW